MTRKFYAQASEYQTEDLIQLREMFMAMYNLTEHDKFTIDVFDMKTNKLITTIHAAGWD
jgi:hypothetical protein